MYFFSLILQNDIGPKGATSRYQIVYSVHHNN